MLIINADDYGRNRVASDKALFCYKSGRITSASGMMFMRDSERSAELALSAELDVGLHLNCTLAFDGRVPSPRLIEYQRNVAKFLLRNNYFKLLYNPGLRNQIKYVYESQYDEYARLYRGIPSHIDGHHHMHLCSNVIIDGIIPKGFRVRTSLSFGAGEKSLLNRLYRKFLGVCLSRRYICTDFLFSISPFRPEKLLQAVNLAAKSNVEMMVHPEKKDEFEYLMNEEYLQIISRVQRGSFKELNRRPQLNR
jgi:chitin disaccharide deacetylase